MGDEVFLLCNNLASVHFEGNAPVIAADTSPFSNPNTTVYYLPGTTGWAEFSYISGLTPILWNPTIQVNGANFGVQSNQFGFNITGTTNIPIVVEACTNLTSPIWTPLTNVTLTNGIFYFSDPQWTNYSSRFYGLGWP